MDIKVTNENNGQTVHAVSGDRLTVTLPWAAGSGFIWQAVDTTAGLLQYIRHEGEDPAKPGAPVSIHFVFLITGAGVIQLNYARPWDELTPPVKWWMVKIEPPVSATPPAGGPIVSAS
jgi:predicted secreted protein